MKNDTPDTPDTLEWFRSLTDVQQEIVLQRLRAVALAWAVLALALIMAWPL